MNARQKAKTDMFKAIEQVCDDNSNILGEIVAFQNAFNQFKTLLAQLLETEQLRSLPLSGIAADKSADRARLCDLLTTIGGFIYAYASANKNETLKAEVNYTRSKFLQMREDQLVSVSQSIHALGTANKDSLKDFSITDANLADLQGAINAFKESLSKPIEIGKFTIRVTANGFQDYEIDEFKIKLGETHKLNIGRLSLI